MNWLRNVKWMVVCVCVMGLMAGCGDDEDDSGGSSTGGGLSGSLGGIDEAGGTGGTGGTGGSGATNLSCLELNECVGDCNEDEACIDECGTRAAPGEDQKLIDLYTCWSENNCSSGGSDCVQTYCSSELASCTGQSTGGGGQCPIPAHSGQLNCGQLGQCLSDAPSETCEDQCVNESSSAAQQQLSALLRCYNDHCANSSDDNCMSQYCYDEATSCEGL